MEATDAAEDARFGQARGDEPPAELADPGTRDARIRRCLDELEAEHAAREQAAAEQAAEQAGRVADYMRRAEADDAAAGQPPTGTDPVEVARARVRRHERPYGPDHRYTRRSRRAAERAPKPPRTPPTKPTRTPPRVAPARRAG